MMFGISGREQADQRMRLVGALGVCGLRIDPAGLAADAAFWSTWAAMAHVASQATAGLGQLLPSDELAAKPAQLRLLDAGICVDGGGRVEVTLNKAEEYAASP